MKARAFISGEIRHPQEERRGSRVKAVDEAGIPNFLLLANDKGWVVGGGQ